MSRIVVLGSGAWGTAIALSLYRRGGHDVSLWSHSDEEARADRAPRAKKALSAGISAAHAILKSLRMRAVATGGNSGLGRSVGVPAANADAACARICTTASLS